MKITKLETYKGYDIDPFKNGCTGSFEGDEVFFDTVQEARSFIDEMIAFSF